MMNQLNLKNENCLFCSESKVQVLIPAEALPDKINVLNCSQCGLVFLETRGDKSSLDPDETVYWDDAEQKRIYLEDKIQDIFVQEFEDRLACMEKISEKKGKLLDVGCGVGHFLMTARKRGWSVEGLDISKTASDVAKELYGLNVHIGMLESSGLVPDQYDAITLWDVIEHLRRPIEDMTSANRLLKVGGLLVMKTPNEESFFKQIALFLYRLIGSRAAFLLKYVYYVPHYFSYSQKTMDLLLKKCGFEAVQYETDQTPEDFGKEKINVHYKKDAKRKIIISLLPVAMFLGKVFRRQNKLVVYARKRCSI